MGEEDDEWKVEKIMRERGKKLKSNSEQNLDWEEKTT